MQTSHLKFSIHSYAIISHEKNENIINIQPPSKYILLEKCSSFDQLSRNFTINRFTLLLFYTLNRNLNVMNNFTTLMEWVEPFAFLVEMAFLRKKECPRIDKINCR